MTGEVRKKGLPFPDPFGILESLTEGAFYDPLRPIPLARKGEEEYAEKVTAEIERLKQLAQSTSNEGRRKTIEDTINFLNTQLRHSFMESPPDLLPIEVRVQRYVDLLEQAHLIAPCVGCKKLVESAIVGARVYQEMDTRGLSREEMTQEEIDRIKIRVNEDLQKVG